MQCGAICQIFWQDCKIRKGLYGSEKKANTHLKHSLRGKMCLLYACSVWFLAKISRMFCCVHTISFFFPQQDGSVFFFRFFYSRVLVFLQNTFFKCSFDRCCLFITLTVKKKRRRRKAVLLCTLLCLLSKALNQRNCLKL